MPANGGCHRTMFFRPGARDELIYFVCRRSLAVQERAIASTRWLQF
jgi:hypothetical protein